MYERKCALCTERGVFAMIKKNALIKSGPIYMFKVYMYVALASSYLLSLYILYKTSHVRKFSCIYSTLERICAVDAPEKFDAK